MKMRAFLLGSAAALIAVSGARAADAVVVVPEPEAVEYVRVCDVYGAGFFYIPGTETCIKLGGYLRYEMYYADIDGVDDVFSKFARFQLNVDVRNETEWGTLRSYVDAHFDWHSQLGNAAYADQAFIELIMGAGTVRLGKTDTLYSRFLAYGNTLGPFEGAYAFNNTGELSYTYDNGSGFSAAASLIELGGTTDFDVGVEGGVKYSTDTWLIGAMAGYDSAAEEWGAKIRGQVVFAPVTVGVQALYSSGPSVYAILNPVDGSVSEWSVMPYARVDVTETLAVQGSVQWFDDTATANDVWQVSAGLDWRPITGLQIRPEVRYTDEVDAWEAIVRFDRSF